MASENVRKNCIEKKNTKLMFSNHVSDHFWRTVSGVGFPAVRSAFLDPHNAWKTPLSDLLERYENRRFAVLGCVLPAVLCVLRPIFPLSLRFREVLLGNVAMRGRVRPRRPPTPWKLRKETFFGLRGFRCMISPNFAEKMAITS